MHKTGKLIAIEGLEGAGKSTALNVVLETLQQHNIEAITSREPGGTLISEALRSILKNPDYQGTMDARTELLLMYAARVQLVEQVIKPALNRGCWVIVDRFELSTLAYQGGGRGLDESMIRALSLFCLQGLTPDLTIFMDIHPDKGMQRVKQRGQQDRFEQENTIFFAKVYDRYLSVLDKTVGSVKIDASLALSHVMDTIKNTMNQFIVDNHA
jgi:dTMP kinase